MDLFVEPQGVLRGTAASQVQRLLLGSTGCVSAIWQAAWRLRFEHKSCKRNGWGPALTPCRLAVSLQVKNILYHCVKEAASSLRKSGSEKDDEEHNSWCPLSLVQAFHRWLRLPSAPRPFHTLLLLPWRAVSRDHNKWLAQSWSCDPEDLTVWPTFMSHIQWPVRGTAALVITPNL